MIELLISLILLIIILISSITDIWYMEVPDWLSIGSIITGLGIRVILSVESNSFKPIISGIIGFAIFLILAFVLYYTGQWGGGDAKLIMGIGAFLGFETKLFYFIIYTLIASAIYGLLWFLFLGIKKRTEVYKEIKKNIKTKKFQTIRLIMLIILTAILVVIWSSSLLIQLKLILLSFCFVMFFGVYLSLFVQSVEKVCLYEFVHPRKLVEGDWIAENIVVHNKVIWGPKKLGVTKKIIKELIELASNKKIKFVIIKKGIPFIPAFLIGYVLTLFLSNTWLL